MNRKVDKTKWEKLLSEIEKKVTDVSFRTWIQPMTPVEIDDEASVIYCAVSKDYVIDVLKVRYMTMVEETIFELFNKKYKVIVRLLSENEIKELQNEGNDKKSKIKHLPSEEEYEMNEEYFLNPRYNFENFIVGPNNEHAHAVSLAVAKNPADAYNPLFIYGGSGLGKTHLMHAIGHHILANNPEMKVLYVSSEMFTSELVKAIHDSKNPNDKMRIFKNKYRNVDVLLIDDIQFIEGKESTQTEFFHTFNTLYDYNKQIIISSDRHPSKLRDLDERLKSRFQWNMITDIQPPDFETRVAILIKKAELEGINIDEGLMEVIELIATKVKFNVRELESALTRIISYSKIFKHKINAQYAKTTLDDIFSAGDFDITCESIKKTVCKKYGIKVADIESAKRKREFSHPRQIAMYLCRELTDSSLPKIGEYFGGRDHTTVLHAYEKISSEIKTNNILAEEIKNIKDELQ